MDHSAFVQRLLRGELKTAAEKSIPTVAVDLDGTLLKYDGWRGEDHFGDPRPGARKALEEFQRKGYRIIIFTTRGDTQAVKDRLHELDIPYDYVNENPDQPPGTSDKVVADVYLDDRAIDARSAWSRLTGQVTRRLDKEGEARRRVKIQQPSRTTVRRGQSVVRNTSKPGKKIPKYQETHEQSGGSEARDLGT